MIFKNIVKRDRYKIFRGDFKIIQNDFDEEFYKNENKDLTNFKQDLALHYLEHGSREGRRPTASFDPHYYRRAYKEKIGDLEPFVHYIKEGRKLGLVGSSQEYFYSDQLVYQNGVVPSCRPRNENDYALEIPLAANLTKFSFDRVAAIIHAFYPELMSDIFSRLEISPCKIDVFISTDKEEKADIVREIAKEYTNGIVAVRVIENRGRDIGPMIFGFRDVFDAYEVFLHLHTKRSPHGGNALEPWRDYLYDNLIGSKDIIATNLSLLKRDRIGFVFPQHFYVLRGILNWGFNFEKASKLLRMVGVFLSKDMVLEFPSGTMFWARTEALKPLLDLKLAPKDFDYEAGQVDGTLAHAVERSLLFFAESAGFTWVKVLMKETDYPYQKCVLHIKTDIDLSEALSLVYKPLISIPASGRCASNRAMPETRDILFAPSNNVRQRIVLFVPSINPRQTFGGISTALNIFNKLMLLLENDFDFAIIATDAPIEAEGEKAFAEFARHPLGQADIGKGNILIDAFNRDSARFQTRASDIYFATAWWTASFARNGQVFQKKFFGSSQKFIYLIQDFEPDFYGWSSSYALAENTYRNSEDFIAIINSEELYKFFIDGKYGIKNALCLPYKINDRIDKMISPERRQPIIVFYGRPSVKRNAFEIVCDGLSIWQMRNPVSAASWRIISVGEEYPEDWPMPTQNVTVLGKLTLEQYVYWLNRASIGISLMISPHPSYPPLEMAEAGLMTITNDHDFKEMGKRFDLISMPYISSELLAQAIEKCVDRYDNGKYSCNTMRGVQKEFDKTDFRMYSLESLVAYFR